MLQKYTKFVVFTLTVLFATWLADLIVTLLAGNDSTYKMVAVKMAVTVLIYVPLLNILEKTVKKSATKLANKSKNIGNNRVLGLTIGFAIGLGVLFLLFSITLINKPWDLLGHIK